MKRQIKKTCQDIESQENIEILFCVESGSRSWGMESKDSDYDVRFVYKRPLSEYLKVNKRGEVITRAFDKEGKPHSQEGSYIDVCGFDVFKFVRMLSASNPTVIEWLQSEILYYGKKSKVFVDYAENNYKQISLYYHYKSMCKQNYLKSIKTSNLVTYKKYLYAMRGLVNAKWVASGAGDEGMGGNLPCIKFEDTLDIIESNDKKLNGVLIEKYERIPKQIIAKLREIIKAKKGQKEKDILQNIVRLDNYIESFLKEDSEAPKEKQLATTLILDQEVLKIFNLKGD